jgi:hypothetical protein
MFLARFGKRRKHKMTPQIFQEGAISPHISKARESTPSNIFLAQLSCMVTQGKNKAKKNKERMTDC